MSKQRQHSRGSLLLYKSYELGSEIPPKKTDTIKNVMHFEPQSHSDHYKTPFFTLQLNKCLINYNPCNFDFLKYLKIIPCIIKLESFFF